MHTKIQFVVLTIPKSIRVATSAFQEMAALEYNCIYPSSRVPCTGASLCIPVQLYAYNQESSVSPVVTSLSSGYRFFANRSTLRHCGGKDLVLTSGRTESLYQCVDINTGK